MSWQYTGDPLTVPLDAVRFLIGDTNGADPQCQDGEINFTLAQYGQNVYKAASLCCKTIAARYARLADTTIETLRVSHSQKQAHYLELASTLWDTAMGVVVPVPFIAGISKADIYANRINPDRVLSAFRDDLFDNYRAGAVPNSEMEMLDDI
jgi:hypothetical protein